jgi:RNA ligase
VKYDLSEFEKRVELGFLRKSEYKSLILYGYTDKCTFERAWDEYTLIARGLILNKDTGDVVGKCIPKFFNLGEMEQTFLKNLPDLPYTVSEKVDGSLGIIFHYEGEWHVSTRGSFYSDQAAKGAELLKKYNLSSIEPNTTLLAEIIYPQNRIIINYGDTEELVLLGAFRRNDGYEHDHETVQYMAASMGMRMAKSYNYTIPEMIALQETLPKDDEGFVVRFENGTRVKIKGKEYLRIAKLMSSLSPIALWETMKGGKVDQTYLQQLPEELRKDYEPYVAELDQQYKNVLVTIALETVTHNLKNFGPDWRKNVGLYLANNDVKYSQGIFPFLLGKNDALDGYILKQIRPDGNSMKVLQ